MGIDIANENTVDVQLRQNPICVISKETFGDDAVHDIQTNNTWTENPYVEEYAVVPDDMVQDIMETCGYCDITLNEDGTEVVSFTAREIPVQEEPTPPTEEELLAVAKESKRREVNEDCEEAIIRGINVTLSDGSVEHFDLKDRDQMNLFGKQLQVSQGVERIEYHTDTDPVSNCKYYSNTDMQKIITMAMWHVSYHQTYCISLKTWLDACQTVDEIQEIFYGADIPEEYRGEVLKSYLVDIASMAEEGNETAV